MGALSHIIAGTVTNNTGGTWTTTLANLTFGNAGANIQSHDLDANNVTISGNRRMFSNWTINGDLLIDNTYSLNNYDNVGLNFENIICRGNWTNNGTFVNLNAGVRGGTVTFDASTDVNIYNEGINAPASYFYDVVLEIVQVQM
jgi:dipeptidyl aminopeptidase/acylaminoacyl peptidase